MSQCDVILRVLSAHPNAWIPMPFLAKECHRQGLSESYAIHSRIADLRRRGYQIENKVYNEGQQKKSFYKLIQ